MTKKTQILLTNDDGIRSPGLWAAAGALASLGHVTVAAPREQASGMGRSLPNNSSGLIHEQTLQINGQEWTVYAVDGSPAQAVQHGALEILPQMPDLVVSGINYGENVGLGVTISGTVGAALEAASLGIPALAISLQAAPHYHLSYSEDVDFLGAAHFAAFFGRILLEKKMLDDVQVLKVDVPSDAGPETDWQITRLARQRYYEPVRPERTSWDTPGRVSYRDAAILDDSFRDTDVYAVRIQHLVSVTPISLDMTSRIKPEELEKQLRGN